MSKPLRVLAIHNNERTPLKDVYSETLLSDLLAKLATIAKTSADRIQISSGFPRHTIDLSNLSKPVSASGISNGDVIHIQVDARSSASTSSALSTSSSSQHNNNAPPASSTSPSVRPTSQAPSSSSSGKRGYRVKISDDNSCLFASVAFASNPSSPADSSILRAEVAVGVLAHPALNEATLEMTQEAYAAAIQSPSKWGGEIELMLLSEIRALQLVAIDVESGAHVVYGEGSNAENISFLLYSGIHYDVFAMGPDDFKAPSSASTSSSTSTSSSKSKGNSPVVNARDLPPLHQLQTKFKAGSMEARNAMNEALQVAAQMKSAHEYVNVNRFTLSCSVCGAGVVGQKGALEHANATGHTAFQEYAQ